MTEPIKKCKEHLKLNDCVIALYKDGKIYDSNVRGIAPLVQWLKESPAILKDSFVADKVIGKAAALLMAYGGVKEVYANVISIPAAKCLQENKIPFSYGETVPRIVNRTKDGLCPMEMKCMDIDSPKEAYALFCQ